MKYRVTHYQVKFLGCILVKAISGETLEYNILYHENSFLIPALRCLLCNALIQHHFDFACSAWYPNLIKKIKQNSKYYKLVYMCFCLQFSKLKYLMKSFIIWTGYMWLIDSNKVSAQLFLNISMKNALIFWKKFLMKSSFTLNLILI